MTGDRAMSSSVKAVIKLFRLLASKRRVSSRVVHTVRKATIGADLASERIQLVLDLENSPWTNRTSRTLKGDSRFDPDHKSDERPLGSTSNSRRTSETGDQGFRSHGRQVHGAPSKT